MMNVHTLAARRIEIEDAYTAHLEHDIDPGMALRALSPWMQEIADSDQWRRVWIRQGARLETSSAGLQRWSSVTFDEGKARNVPAWLQTRLDREWKEIELFGDHRSGRTCPACNEDRDKLASVPLRYGSRAFHAVVRALRRRHRRALARDFRRSISPEVRAMVAHLRAFRSLGGDLLAMAA